MALHVNYEIRWKNFRAFEDTDWITIRPLTVLIGPNNSGKTSILTPMLLMNQTMSSRDTVTPLVTRGPLVNAGTFKDIIHKRDTTKQLFLGFRFHVHDRKGRIKKVRSYPPGSVELTLVAGEQSEDILLKRYELFDIYNRPYLYQFRRPSGAYTLKGLKRDRMTKAERDAILRSRPINFLFSSASTLYEYRSHALTERDEGTRSRKPSAEFLEYVATVGFAFESLRSLFSGLSYIGPLRDRPQRYYEMSGEIPRSVGTRGEHTANLLRRKFKGIKKELNSWIKRFEFGDSLHLQDLSEDLFSLSFETKRLAARTNIADAGFGASQVLPLIVQALAAPKGSLTIAEQPEIHLNPRLQCVLADLFVEMANSDHRVIIETHSEHLLLRLRRLVASGDIKHQKVAIYFVEKSGDTSTIRPIPLEKNGHISSEVWPKGFFEETLRESLVLVAEQSKTDVKGD